MSKYIAHHGVLGQKWGVRRFQPYPDGYHGEGKFVGEDSKGNKITKKQYKKNKKELRKDVKNYSLATDYSGAILYKKDDRIAKKNAKAKTYSQKMKVENAREKFNRDVERNKRMKNDLAKLLSIAEKDYGMVFSKKYYPKESYKESNKSYGRKIGTKMATAHLIAGIPGDVVLGVATTRKINEILKQY